ncbi:polypeptide N-acetylgalactosaminyltransferase 18-like isoform X2 [Stigmatopora nigra]
MWFCRRTKTLVSICVVLSGMTNIVCLLYVGWITNFMANSGSKVQETDVELERKLDEDSKGETLRIMERLDKLESVVNEHIKDKPKKEDEDDSSSLATDSSSSMFDHWGHHLGPGSRKVAIKKFRYFGYNSYLSDRLSITRPIPDFRPDGCKNMWYSSDLPELSIIFIFVNEALSVLLRSVNTAIQRTPSHILKEIILVDDHSTNMELKEHLQSFVDEMNDQHGPEFIKVVHHQKQEGLIRSRVSGWRVASAAVVAFFDAHVEFNTGWSEPVLQRIKEKRTRVVSPSFDNIKYDTFEMEEYPLSAQGFDWELWCRYLNPPKSWWTMHNHTVPIRKYFEEIGLLDEGMDIYGGENVELSIRVWLCGGSIEVLPCSRIAHIERAHKPYTQNLTALVRRNALRVAEVWMDEYKNHVYMAWNIPFRNSGINIGDMTERKALRTRLKCQPFSWFLANIYPELRSYNNTVAYGVLKNSLRNDLCLDQGQNTDNIPIMYLCHGITAQNVYYTSSQQLRLGVLSPTIDDDDNKCLVDVNSKPRLLECAYAATKHMKLTWIFTPDGSIRNIESQRCLEIVESTQSEFSLRLAIQDCNGQKWTITNILTLLPK